MTCNPHKVPSCRFDGVTKEPVCRDCMIYINAKRQDKGLRPFEIPPGAYEPMPESEL